MIILRKSLKISMYSSIMQFKNSILQYLGGKLTKVGVGGLLIRREKF